MTITSTAFPAIIKGMSTGNTGVPIIRNANIGDTKATTAAEGNPANIHDETKMKFTQEPVTNCPRGRVIACAVTSSATNAAVRVIHKIRLRFFSNN